MLLLVEGEVARTGTEIGTSSRDGKGGGWTVLCCSWRDSRDTESGFEEEYVLEFEFEVYSACENSSKSDVRLH